MFCRRRSSQKSWTYHALLKENVSTSWEKLVAREIWSLAPAALGGMLLWVWRCVVFSWASGGKKSLVVRKGEVGKLSVERTRG